MEWNPVKEVKFLAVHCAATTAKMDIGVAEIRRWHREQGWLDIGYHYVIRRNGVVEKGRADNVPGAHVRGFNHLSLGICLAGGVAADGKTAENNFTPAQFDSLEKLLRTLKKTYPTAVIQGHRDFPNVAKACPSFEVKDFVKQRSIV